MSRKLGSIKAVVDWIEIEVVLAAPTNLKAMRVALGPLLPTSPHAVPIDGSKNSARVWRYRHHDPSRLDDVEAVLTHLDAKFSFAATPVVAAIEVALDDYAGGPERVADWYRRLNRFVQGGNRRLYRNFVGSGLEIPRQSESLVRKLADGYQIGIGDKDGEIFQHLYFKTTDNNGRALDKAGNAVLPRSRYEVRLVAGGLPCTSLEDWRSFRFESLSEWFRFRLPADDLDDFQQLVLDAQPQIGERIKRRRKGGGTRLNNPSTKADEENEIVRAALRTLSRRWGRQRAEIRAKQPIEAQ